MAAADRAAEVFSAISQPRGQKLVALAKNDPALAKRIDDAVRSFDETGSQRDLLRLLGETTGMTDARAARMPDMPYDMPPAKPSTDAVERRLVEQDLGPVGEVMPQPAVRTALDEIIGAGGGDNLIERLAGMTPRPEYSLDIANSRNILNQDITDLFPPTASGVADVMPGAAVPSSPGTAMIPAGPRGLSAGGGGGLIVPPGRGLTTTGGPRDLSVPQRAMQTPQQRLPAPNQRRIAGPAAGGNLPPPRRPVINGPDMPPRGDALLGGRRAAAGAAGLGLAAGVIGARLAMEPGLLGDSEGGMSTADLAAETSPPPSVQTEEPAPLGPRDQAQELMRKLNLMRREAGGEVPEAPAMMREIDRLMAMSNQTMAAASRGEVATGGSDYHMQAARLMAQLNAMRSRAGGEVPQARQMMAEITRLQRMGDEQRNARQAPRRAG